jgi:transmembrane sensor
MLIQKRRVPEVEQGLTWRTGVLTFHDTPLADAVAEFNRYNSRKIVILDPAIAAMQVGGIFGATQPSQFVRLLEGAFPIRVIEEPDQITLMQR